jgi:diadenosine tetraphosphate (Ap4A) HIT family hydrolase
MTDGRQHVEPAPASACPFCQRASLEIILEETPHFFLLVDHAPLAEGHLLIVPRAHYACYGAVPPALDVELLALKGRVETFLTGTYGPIVFFEHGVFRQTVYHAHLHAIPVDASSIDIVALAGDGGLLMRSQDDLRMWYDTHGRYFFLELPGQEYAPGRAILFPPIMERYSHVLGTLRAAAGRRAEWAPQPIRRAFGQSKMRSLADAWRAREEA